MDRFILPLAPDGWIYFREYGIWYGIPVGPGSAMEVQPRVWSYLSRGFRLTGDAPESMQ